MSAISEEMEGATERLIRKVNPGAAIELPHALKEAETSPEQVGWICKSCAHTQNHIGWGAQCESCNNFEVLKELYK
jgi:rubrerythrin